jgi:hypothetical protein
MLASAARREKKKDSLDADAPGLVASGGIGGDHQAGGIHAVFLFFASQNTGKIQLQPPIWRD